MLARNCFGNATIGFPDNWAGVLRTICLAILLLRGGLEITFRGKGLIVLLIAFIPQTVEASVAAALARSFFGMPTDVSYCLGYTIGCVGSAIVVQ